MPDEQQAIDDKSLKAAMRRFIELKADENFLAQHGAHAVSISRRRKRDGSRTQELCLVLHVEPGLKPVNHGDAPAATPILDPIPFTDPDTGITFQLPTDVMEDRPARLHKGGKKATPVAGGVSCCGTPKTGLDHLIGTLGGWVWDLDDDTYVALSNMHIFGDPNDRVYQPDYTSRVKQGAFGRVRRVAPEPADQPPYRADAAIVRARPTKSPSFLVGSVGPAVMAASDVDPDDAVEKTGFGTDFTRGIVTDEAWSGIIEDPRSGVKRRFLDCLYVVPREADQKWTLAGDSGSLIFASDRSVAGAKPVVGLHVAGDDLGAYGIACRIEHVFSRLRLTTLPEGLLTRLAKDVLGNLPPGATDSMRADRALEVDALKTLMINFATYCRQNQTGRSLLALLDRGRPALVSALAQSSTTRSKGARVLRRVFFGRGQVADILAVPIDKGLLDAVRALADALKSASKGELRELLSDLRATLPKAGKKTLGQYLLDDA